MDLGLTGRTAVITGGSKGIGFGCAISLANEGCHIHLASRDQETLETAQANLKQQTGADAEIHPIDLSASGSADKLLGATGTPDILVNNAGAIPGGNLQAIDEATWRQAWDLKVFGYINMCRATYALMKEKGKGTIINVTGLAADKHDFSYIAGTAGNASLNAFTRALGSYSLEDGIRVMAVSPGPVETERLVTLLKTRAKGEKGTDDGWRDYLAAQPLGRAAAVQEIADTVTFMASDRASYTTGTVINVDGGLLSRGGVF
jgi:3-oxoacyl-[acyl-carrier protein] reductase